MFPFSKAIRFPILIFGKVTIKNVRKGRLVFNCPLTTGILQIGKRSLGFLDKHNCRTIWNVAGTLYVHGKASIGQGCCVEVEKDQITFGDDCLLSWDLLIMDTDWHKVISTTDGGILNPSKPINIGNHVWIGCRSLILKGVNISDNVIVAANSTISRNIDEEFVVVGSNGVLKENVGWEY